MLRRSLPKFSLFSVLKEELGKAKELLTHDLTNYSKFLSGEDISDREKKIREKHQEMAQKDAAAAAEVRSKMTWKEKMSAAMDELKNSTKTNAAVVAMVQHCTRAHMAEVAVEQDIDIRNIHIITEGVRSEAGIEVGEKVVGYIEAPSATNEEVMAYATKLEKACPAARTHGGIEWRRSPSTPAPSEPSTNRKPKFGSDDDFEFPTGAGFGFTSTPSSSSSSSSSPLKNTKLVVDDEKFVDDLPHGSPFHQKQQHDVLEEKQHLQQQQKQQDLGSFKPSKKTGNEFTDMNRTAYDLAASLEKAKLKTRMMEDESEKRATAEALRKFREGREREEAEKTKMVREEEEKASSSSSTDKEETTSSEGEAPKKGFGSLKEMGLFGKK